jgi:hypothetical protein
MLKSRPDGDQYLIAVNMDNAPVDVEFRFNHSVTGLTNLYGGGQAAGGGTQVISDTMPPFAARVYRFDFSGYPDSDNDGVSNALDNCRDEYNPEQVDQDNDNAGAACDPGDFVDDYDLDGCADGEELGLDEGLGGRRNPTYPWDFYDVDADRVITVAGDVLAVAGAFGPPGPNYTPQKDRSPGPPPGTDPKDPNNNEPWDLGPPDQVISVGVDVFGVAQQFGHSCNAPP